MTNAQFRETIDLIRRRAEAWLKVMEHDDPAAEAQPNQLTVFRLNIKDALNLLQQREGA